MFGPIHFLILIGFISEMYRLWIAPSCVAVGLLASQCRVVQAMCIIGVGFSLYVAAPLFTVRAIAHAKPHGPCFAKPRTHHVRVFQS